MATMQMSVDMFKMPSELTCQEIDEFLKNLTASEYQSRNMTPEDYIDSLRSPHCKPKPYPSVQGLKKWTAMIILILCLIFGLIGNALSATIMFRRSRRGLTSYFYLALLAIVDICVLYSSCLLFLLEITFDYHPQVHSPWLCRVAFYIQHLVTYISAWLIVAVTFERFIVVRYPFQSIRVCRMRVAYTTTIIIFLFFSIYTAHCFFTMDLITINPQTVDGYHPNHVVCDVTIYQTLLSFMDLCFYSVLPSILILIFNILIIITMFHAIRKRRDYLQANSYTPETDIFHRNKNKTSSTHRTQFFRSRSAESSPAIRPHTPTHKPRFHHHSQNNQFIEQKPNKKNAFDPTSDTGIRLTCLLLMISLLFVICTLPISIRSLIADYLSRQKSTTHWQITQLCLTILMFLNHSINFALYCLTGRKFRSECRKLLCSLWLLKDIHISCASNPDPDRLHPHQHQQLLPIERNRYIVPRQQHLLQPHPRPHTLTLSPLLKAVPL